MQIHHVRSLRHTTPVGSSVTAGTTSILFISVVPVLIKYLKINMHSIKTRALNAAPEIFKQKYAPDPLRQARFSPPGGCNKGTAVRYESKSELISHSNSNRASLCDPSLFMCALKFH